MGKGSGVTELTRLSDARDKGIPWRKWGPYLSERQWGTVREDYSENGDAWNYFSHDQARSRAYRWGEDGLAGLSDEKQRLCFALALWNGEDPILKERLFGLTNAEGNHGEDVKEYYFYLDSTPTHSYMKWLYKYPQRAYPYDDLVATNRGRIARRSSSTSFSTPASSTTTATSTSSSSTPRPRRRTCSSGSRWRTGGRKRRRCTCCPPSGSATRGRGGPIRPKPALRAGARRGRARGWSRPPTPSSASAGCTWRETCRCSSPRTRRTTSASSAARTPAPTSRTAINDYVVHGREEAVNPDGAGTKVAAHHRADGGGGRPRRSCGFGSPTPPRADRRTLLAGSTRRSRRAGARRTSSTARSPRPRRPKTKRG